MGRINVTFTIFEELYAPTVASMRGGCEVGQCKIVEGKSERNYKGMSSIYLKQGVLSLEYIVVYI